MGLCMGNGWGGVDKAFGEVGETVEVGGYFGYSGLIFFVVDLPAEELTRVG